MTNSWAVDSKDQGSDSSSEDEGSSAEVQSNGNISSRSSAGDAEESDEDKGDVAEPEDQDMAGSSDSSANNSEYEPIIDREDIEKCKELSKMAKARRDKRSKLDYAVWEFCLVLTSFICFRVDEVAAPVGPTVRLPLWRGLLGLWQAWKYPTSIFREAR